MIVFSQTSLTEWEHFEEGIETIGVMKGTPYLRLKRSTVKKNVRITLKNPVLPTDLDRKAYENKEDPLSLYKLFQEYIKMTGGPEHCKGAFYRRLAPTSVLRQRRNDGLSTDFILGIRTGNENKRSRSDRMGSGTLQQLMKTFGSICGLTNFEEFTIHTSRGANIGKMSTSDIHIPKDTRLAAARHKSEITIDPPQEPNPELAAALAIVKAYNDKKSSDVAPVDSSSVPSVAVSVPAASGYSAPTLQSARPPISEIGPPVDPLVAVSVPAVAGYFAPPFHSATPPISNVVPVGYRDPNLAYHQHPPNFRPTIPPNLSYPPQHAYHPYGPSQISIQHSLQYGANQMPQPPPHPSYQQNSQYYFNQPHGYHPFNPYHGWFG